MKYLFIPFVVICIALGFWLMDVQQDAAKQHDDDVSQITDLSNQLTSAQGQVADRESALTVLSNRLDEGRAAFSSLSNRLDEVRSVIPAYLEQITNLTRSVGENEEQNRQLVQYVGELTNQVMDLSGQILMANTNLARMAQEYSLLENRLRRDVAERVVVERNFSNYTVLQMQIERMKMTNAPTKAVMPKDIYAGLNVEIDENGEAHVISPDLPPDRSGRL